MGFRMIFGSSILLSSECLWSTTRLAGCSKRTCYMLTVASPRGSNLYVSLHCLKGLSRSVCLTLLYSKDRLRKRVRVTSGLLKECETHHLNRRLRNPIPLVSPETWHSLHSVIQPSLYTAVYSCMQTLNVNNLIMNAVSLKSIGGLFLSTNPK